jgi:hypothetical protein
MEEITDKKQALNKGLVGKVLTGVGLGQLAHFSICPFHGLPALLLKTGLISGTVATPFIAVNDYLVSKITPIVSTARGDNADYSQISPIRYNRRDRTINYTNPNREIAKDIVDYSGWSLALGIPVIMIGISYRNRNKKWEALKNE